MHPLKPLSYLAPGTVPGSPTSSVRSLTGSLDFDEYSGISAKQIETDKAERVRFDQINDSIRSALPDRIMMVLMSIQQRMSTPFFRQSLGQKMIAFSTRKGNTEIQFMADPWSQRWSCTPDFSGYLTTILSKDDIDFINANMTLPE